LNLVNNIKVWRRIMDIKLNEKEVIIILDALVEALAFDNNADDIKVVYNKIVKQTNMDKYEMLG